MTKTWANWICSAPRTTRPVTLCGNVYATLTDEEINAWHKHFETIDGAVAMYAECNGYIYAAQNQTSPGLAEQMLAQHIRLLVQLRPHAEAWLAECMKKRAAEDEEYHAGLMKGNRETPQ